MMNFLKLLQSKAHLVNNAIESCLSFAPMPQGRLAEAMRYSARAGGKRIRPCLALFCCEAAGGRDEDVLPFAVAIELIHTYSLIHDDLPAMDNDDLRRGRPTNHLVYGEAMAILAGDALLNFAVETALDAPVPDNVKVKALRAIMKASGIYGMCGGQAIDISNGVSDIDSLRVMHSLKTGSLILASARAGAIAAGKPEDMFDDYAESLGIAFQIKDDILDFCGDSELLGKPVGSDERNTKTTFVTLLGLNEAERLLREHTASAVSAAERLGKSGEVLKELAVYLLSRRS